VSATFQRYLPELTPRQEAVAFRFDNDLGLITRCLCEHPSLVLNGPLFHYTNEAGLRGILESGTLWLSSIRAMNDPSEHLHGMGIASKAIAAAAVHPWVDGKFKLVAEILSDYRWFAEIGDYFTVSFSREEDDLSQWRAYGADGHGFTLGFSSNELNKAFNQIDIFGTPGIPAFPVLYDDDLLVRVVNEIISIAIRAIASMPRDEPEEPVVKFMYQRLASSLAWLTLFFKHPHYRSECEVRYTKPQLIAQQPGLKTRTGKTGKVAYIELPWRKYSPAALVSIGVGPSADFEAASNLVSHTLRNTASTPKIRRSSIPYRS
jgi:hypothetical protein